MNNIKNTLISSDIIEGIINKYTKSVVFINDIIKFQKAFVHKSFIIIDNENDESDTYCSINFKTDGSNERLEFLGDKVIDFIVTEYLFDKFPGKDEGFMTKLKSKLVKKESLAILGNYLGFKDYILISSHVERIAGRDNPRLMEDVFESFMGVLYKDQHSDISICREFLINVYETFIDIEKLIESNDNYKDSLLRFFHGKAWGHPVYQLIDSPDRGFISIVTLKKDRVSNEDKPFVEAINYKYRTKYSNSNTEYIVGFGKANTKKASEQNSSKECLTNFKLPLNF